MCYLNPNLKGILTSMAVEMILLLETPTARQSETEEMTDQETKAAVTTKIKVKTPTKTKTGAADTATLTNMKS